jgi:hypothetical protein
MTQPSETTRHEVRGCSPAEALSPGGGDSGRLKLAQTHILVPTIALLAILTWYIVLDGKMDALPEHTPHIEYSAAIPYSPEVGMIQATMGLRYIGNP